ncbi:hypothetical protein [Streptomyces sp. NRRL F-5135]|uniref:hypothetical protein n=1 Tax=Streptomyces sp. NRRL F-5135 TaxID=1463858 RepID=UPI000A71FD5B|nr:hypothetical protein [Streptomyces sp. NRRL F-5135]
MSDGVEPVHDYPADLVTAVVRPYVMTPEEWAEAMLCSSRQESLLLRVLVGLRRLPDE